MNTTWLIGEEAEITFNNKKFTGTIVDETRNMLYVKTKQGVKKIIKKESTVTIHGSRIPGPELVKRPEDRIKK
jgi:RNase P/RNase MRP subunit p29